MEHIKKTIVIFLLFLAYTSNAQGFKDTRRTFSYDTDDTTIMPGDVRTHMIFFEFSKCNFYPEHADTIAQIGRFLIKNPNIKVEISLNTDSRGSQQGNMGLSKCRANEIASYLKEIVKTSAHQFIVIPNGEDVPLIPESTINAELNEEIREQYHRINRRTEVKIISTSLK